MSTSIGVAGLNIINGKEAIIEDSMQGLAKQTIKLLKDKKLADKIGRAGKEFVKNNYDWESVVRLHDKIYDQAIKAKK